MDSMHIWIGAIGLVISASGVFVAFAINMITIVFFAGKYSAKIKKHDEEIFRLREEIGDRVKKEMHNQFKETICNKLDALAKDFDKHFSKLDTYQQNSISRWSSIIKHIESKMP